MAKEHPLMGSLRGYFAAHEADIEAIRHEPDFLFRVFGLGFAMGVNHANETFARPIRELAAQTGAAKS